MELINYILSALIVSFGIFCGVILGRIAKEELKPGKKYLIFLQYAIIAVMLVLMVYFRFNVDIVFLFVAALFFVIYRTRFKKQIMPEIYVLFALIFSNAVNGFFISVSALIFLYGFPTGSLLYLNKKWIKPVVINFLLFFLISIILYLLF
jgi:hypothetical protein